ncbi:MAG: DUF2125 domain-containing protein [Alphaproteobacteria bacterium]|nr:DUF2125 domain-containing protein [Alphaproteobacteria bacterium]
MGTESLRKNGYAISYSNVKFSGHPLSIKATFQNPHVKDPKGFIDWQGQEIEISMRPWAFYTLNFYFRGEQKLVVPPCGSFPIGTLHLEGASGMAHLSSKGRLENFTFIVNRLSSFLGEQPQPLSLKDLSLHMSNLTDPLNLKLSLSSELENIEKILNKTPANHPFTVNVVADLSGFKSEFPFPKSLAEWRDGGGVLEVRLLKIDWPPILGEIEGTLTLDEGMYPLGSFSSRISGYREAVTDMVELGWIKKKKATVALFMLDLFASSDDEGEKHLKAPITMQNRVLSIGPAPLLKLQPVGGN